jgi:Zn-dependent peptidase ImmA (M78 family)
MNQQYLENLANSAIEGSGIFESPISLEKIAEKLNLKIVPFEFEEKISAVLKRDKMIIGVNNKHSRLRQRFSIAHELGHYIMGHDIGNTRDFIDDEMCQFNPVEKEANLFASILLMPKDYVKKSVDTKGLDIKRLAGEFEVSEQAMTIRLLELKLIK